MSGRDTVREYNLFPAGTSSSQTAIPALQRFLVSSLFHSGSGKDRRHADRDRVVVDGDKREVGRVRRSAISGELIFGCNVYTDFHRRPECPIHRSTERHNFAQSYRLMEHQVVHPGCNTNPVRVALRRDGGCNIHPFHQSAAEQIPELIRIVRKDKLRHLHLRNLYEVFLHCK